MSEAEYWKGVALWLADVTAATAYDLIHRKSTGRGERERQARIAEITAAAIEGKGCPRARDVEVVAERLREVGAP